jgi:hypothetical protein
MQPTYLPWSGYFHLASRVDTFVFLDDVQFERRSWQSRNKILINGKESLLVVPVKHAPQQTLIADIQISEDLSWHKKHLRSIQVAYPNLWRDPYLKDSLVAIFERSHHSLADLNIDLIKMLFEWLELKCSVVRASTLACPGSRSQHLADICIFLNADTYLSPTGSRKYLEEDEFEKVSGLILQYSDFTPNIYHQENTTEFVSHLSVIDVIGQNGLEFAKAYIR